MIDFTTLDLSSGEGQTITGIYASVYRAMSLNKPVYAYNVLSGTNGLATPLAAACVLNEANQNITITTALGVLTVTTADVVTVAQA